MLMKLHSILNNRHLYSFHNNTVLQWDEVNNWSSAFGVPLTIAVSPVESESALTSTLPTAPGRSILTLDDGFELATKDIPTTKLVP